MTPAELTVFSDNHRNIVWQDNLEGAVLFRNESLMWYQNNPDRSTAISYEKLETMSVDEVVAAVNRGLMVEGVTRITGYFARTSAFNPGKKAELRDRKKWTVGEPELTILAEAV